MLDGMFDFDVDEEEVDEEVNKVLMEVAGVAIQGMNLVPVPEAQKKSQDELDAEKLLDELNLPSI